MKEPIVSLLPTEIEKEKRLVVLHLLADPHETGITNFEFLTMQFL